MGHCLILGITMSGKTTLAKKLCAEYLAKGIETLVLDPLNDPGWQASKITDSVDEFLNIFWKSRNCAVFIDESGDIIGRFPENELKETATRGRHWGHNVHYIAQRGTQISATVRDQCSTLFLFASSLRDGQTHSEEWNKPDLSNCYNLHKGEFYYLKDRFSPLELRRIF